MKIKRRVWRLASRGEVILFNHKFMFRARYLKLQTSLHLAFKHINMLRFTNETEEIYFKNSTGS